MATIGQALTEPETGWLRIDDVDSRITCINGTKGTGSSSYWNSTVITINSGGVAKFKFRGSKLRVIGYKSATQSTFVLYIDGVNRGSFNAYVSSGNMTRCLVFDIQDLADTIHDVEIHHSGSRSMIQLDAIDIEDTGYMVHPVLGNPKTSLAEMQVGDYIPCRYTASSGAVGVFSELGTCNMTEIPVAGSATPNGLFNFIKVDKGLLIADRVVQHSISWNALNAGKLIEGNTIQQTSLILRADGTIKDKSNNYPLVTVNSGVSASASQLKINTSSMYFDGTTNGLLQLPPNNALNFGLGDFTIDFWFKWEARMSTYPQIFCGTSSYDGICIGDYGGNKASYVIGGGSNPRIYSTSDVTDGVWHHYAICRKNKVFYLFIDGKLEATDSSYTTQSLDYSVRTMIGREPWSGNRFKGWVDEFRIVKGVALWTSDFTPNTTPYTGNEIKPLIVRSMTGGVAYADNEDKSAFSLTDKGFGAFPNNEWDRYIVNSDLGGAITAGDNNIWNWSYLVTFCQETSITGMTRAFDSYTSDNTKRTYRSRGSSGVYDLITPSYSATDLYAASMGFRPVLQYIEPDGSSRQTNLWY